MTSKIIPLVVAALLAPCASFAQTTETPTQSLADAASHNPSVSGESFDSVFDTEGCKKYSRGSDRKRCRPSLVGEINDSALQYRRGPKSADRKRCNPYK